MNCYCKKCLFLFERRFAQQYLIPTIERLRRTKKNYTFHLAGGFLFSTATVSEEQQCEGFKHCCKSPEKVEQRNNL